MYLLIRGFDLSFRTGISWFTRPMSLFCHQKMTRKREQNLGDPQSISRKASNLRTFQPWKNGRCPRIYEVLILLSRLWADSANGRLHHSRGFDLFNCRFWHDLRGFDLAFSPRETWFTRFWSQERQYIYYIYNVYTRFWSRLRHPDGLLYTRFWSSAPQDPEALCTRFWSLCWHGAGSWFTRFVSLPDARNLQNEIKTS